MKSIYASKLYQASKRKDRIHAALLAPTNLELVQQLAKDLDDEYQVPENFGLEEESKSEQTSDEDVNFDDFIVDEDIDPDKDLMSMDDLKTTKPSSSPKHSAPAKSSPSTSEPPKEAPKADTSELMPESPANEKEPTAASTQVKAATIPDLNLLKNTLNSREDVAGVTRIAQKENEIWIYYNDDVNLNNIMTDVIEYLMNFGGEDFEFNRLARSDNAIVFVGSISTDSMLQQVEASISVDPVSTALDKQGNNKEDVDKGSIYESEIAKLKQLRRQGDLEIKDVVRDGDEIKVIFADRSEKVIPKGVVESGKSCQYLDDEATRSNENREFQQVLEEEQSKLK